jgi:hypothetical protein
MVLIIILSLENRPLASSDGVETEILPRSRV